MKHQVTVKQIIAGDPEWLNDTATGEINGTPFTARIKSRGGLGGTVRWAVNEPFSHGEKVAIARAIWKETK